MEADRWYTACMAHHLRRLSDRRGKRQGLDSTFRLVGDTIHLHQHCWSHSSRWLRLDANLSGRRMCDDGPE